MKKKTPCVECDEPCFGVRCVVCYRKSQSGNNNGNWRGGKIRHKEGYVERHVGRGNHPRAIKRSYVGEHTLVMEEMLGRFLLRHETAHHKNGDRSDNRMSNLELWSKSQPAGQRVTDKVEWATELLSIYAPERLGPFV